MKQFFSYLLPLCAINASLTILPKDYMPRIDVFIYVEQHESLFPSREESSQTLLENQQASATYTSPADSTNPDFYEEYQNFAIAKVNDYVNVRSLPGTDGEILGKLTNGAVAEIQAISGENNDWFQITSGNVSGYIKAEYFLSGEDAANVLDQYINTYATILADRLNVRKEPATDSQKSGYLEADEQVLVLEDLGDWLHIQYTDTIDGYIAKEYTQLTESYLYACSTEESKAQKELWNLRRSRIQTTQYINSENTAISFPATTYTSNEELRKALIENAMQYLGNKYVHGGNSLETGTDCSGFTMLLFAQYGYSISRTPSGQLEKAGRSIDYSEIQPGDIICYTSNGSTCTHVALYIGDGKIIHAANSRKGVVIYNADYDTIMGIKNVID